MNLEWDVDPIRPRVPLLDLPVELIENIFIYSENLRLALTNTLLHHMLSQDIPRLRLCAVIFGQDFTHSLYYPQHILTRVSERDTNLMKLQQLLVD